MPVTSVAAHPAPAEPVEKPTEIVVVDSIMGSGKTSFAIRMMNATQYRQTFEDDGSRFIYITPTLSEVERIKAACSGLDFRDPQPIEGRKLKHFNALIEQGANIASTHALFSLVDRHTRERLLASDYTLVIDEETECVREFQIVKDDIRALFESEMVYTDEKNRLRWNHDKWPDYEGAFDEVRALCDNGALVKVDDSFWVWEFPIEFIKLFRRVYVLSYLFEGSLLSTYLKANGLSYGRKTINSAGELASADPKLERERVEKLKPLITVIQDKHLNAVGTPSGRENPLSATWYDLDIKRGGSKTKRLQLATYNFFRNRVDGKSAENMWSCFKDHRGRLRGSRYAKGWTPCNLRATNDYRDRKHIAYLVNVFMRPRLVQYFKACGVEPNENLYALSQLVQWVFRAQIRDGKPITLFLPSERMRRLFLEWLGEAQTEAAKRAA